eukprot:c17225_g2_i1 orf=569-2245(+)
MSQETSKPSNVFHGKTTVPGLTLAPMPGHGASASSMDHGSFLIYYSPGDESLTASQSHTSISSVVLSSDGSSKEDKILSQNGCQSSLLKERDYIGLAEISSTSSHMELPDEPTALNNVRSGRFDLNFEETDLRLGLGPPEFLQYCSPEDHTLASNVLKGSKTTRSGPGSCSSPVLDSDRPGVGRVIFSTANQCCAPHFSIVTEGSSSHPAHSDICKEQPWPERLEVANERPLGNEKFKDNWVKYNIEHEKVSDNWVRQDSQPLFHQEISSGTDIVHPAVGYICSKASDRRPPAIPDIATSHLWQSQILQNMDPSRRYLQSVQGPLPALEHGAVRSVNVSGHAGTRVLSSARNSVKRGYFEAMGDARQHNTVDCAPGMCETSSTAGMKNTLQLPEEHGSRYSNHPSPFFTCNWAAVKSWAPSSWQNGFDQPGAFKPFTSTVPNKSANGIVPQAEEAADAIGISWGSCGKTREGQSTLEKTITELPQSQPVLAERKYSCSSDPPHQRDQVVGWPPVRSFRKNTIASHPKPDCDKEGQDRSHAAVAGTNEGLLYVKVNMDG